MPEDLTGAETGDLDDISLRLTALHHAADLHRATYRPGDPAGPFGATGVIRTATRLFRGFLDPPVSLRLTFTPPPNQEGDTMLWPIDEPGPIVAVIETLDRRGNVIPNAPGTEDDVQFTLSVEGPVILTPRDDARSAELVLNDQGETELTASVNTVNGPVELKEILQVGPAGIASMRMRFETPGV